MGATLAYINGGDPLSGGGAAVAAETAAQYLARQYDDGQTARDPVTGEFNPNLLPESVKEEIRATTGAIASIVGATGDGGAALNAQIGGVIGQNAVENNYLSLKDVNDLRAELRAAKTEEEKERIFEKYRKKGESKSQALRESCRGKGDECHLNAIAELRNTNQAAATIVNNGLLLSLTESGRTDLSAWGLALDSNLPDLSYHEGQLSGGAKLLDTGVKLSPVVVAAATAGGSKAAQALAGKKTPASLANNRQPSVVDGEMAGGNKPIKLPSNVNFQLLERALQHSIPTKGHPNQLMYTLDDGTRLIFRKDFGDKAHPIGNIFQGKGAIDHYNIEVQIPRANGSVRIIENLHIVPNSSGGFTWWGKDGVTKK